VSSFSIIQDVTRELRQRIFDSLADAPDADIALDSIDRITLAPPREKMTGTPALSLYLFNVEPDPFLRNQRELPMGQAGLRQPPLVLQLRYLVTPLGDDEERNHLVLGRILQRFMTQPFIDSANGTAVGDSFGGASPQVRIVFEALPPDKLASMWMEFQTPLRLSVVYLVRAVAIDSDSGVTEAQRVVEAHTVVGRMEKGAG
jgi:hypothetical protein